MLSACDLHVDLVDADQPQLGAGHFFGDLQTFLQVADFGSLAIIGSNVLVVAAPDIAELRLQMDHIGNTAPTKPRLRVRNGQEANQRQRDWSVAHLGETLTQVMERRGARVDSHATEVVFDPRQRVEPGNAVLSIDRPAVPNSWADAGCRQPALELTPRMPAFSFMILNPGTTSALEIDKMKSKSIEPRSLEVELKLALPTADPAGLAKNLARSPLLARRKSTQVHLHNVYYDTPEQSLRAARVALRVRRAGSETQPRWLQTLKVGGHGDSALSRRGEWEFPISGAALEPGALEATPWSNIDPRGKVFAALKPCFVTAFDRTVWSVRRRDGSVVEVAWDHGHIAAGDWIAPICELELELIAGRPQALFDVAQQIARTVAVLPLAASKSERGYALDQGRVDTALRARPPTLESDLSPPAAAQIVLREMFNQFTTNLNALRTSDDPEVVHQARVGWRRFASARRLFRPILAVDVQPDWEALRPLLSFLGELRDLDVARSETLPAFADAYVADDSQRDKAWIALARSLDNAATLQRKAVRYALEEPAIGAALLAVTHWLEDLPQTNGPDTEVHQRAPSLARWVRRRADRLHARLQAALRQDSNPESQHRVRILAKRMRYAIEALRPLLPKSRTRERYKQAMRLQSGIGAARDVRQAATLATRLEADRGIVEFLRGVAVGRERPG